MYVNFAYTSRQKHSSAIVSAACEAAISGVTGSGVQVKAANGGS